MTRKLGMKGNYEYPADGALMAISIDGTIQRRVHHRLVVADTSLGRLWQTELILRYHTSNSMNHKGRYATWHSIHTRFHWRGMYRDVAAFVRRCEHCRAAKAGRRLQAKFHQPMTANEPFHTVCIDCYKVGKSHSGHIGVLTVRDMLKQQLATQQQLGADQAPHAMDHIVHYIAHRGSSP